MDDRRFIYPVFHFTGFDIIDRFLDLHRDRTGFRVWHEALRPKDFTDTADLAHHIGRRHDHIEIEPVFLLDLLDHLFRADKIRSCILRFLRFVALRDNEHTYFFTGTVREDNSPGAATGTLIGGNLNTMQGIWGTKYFPEITDGTILMIEDSLKDAATVERSFSLLKCAGIFERISGLILGKHEKFDDMGTGRQPYEILQEVMGDVDFPVLAEFDCCHTHPMLTVPIGAKVRLDADAQTVTLLEE